METFWPTEENEKNVTGILNRGNPACLIIFVASGDKRD
jgi:hypothetical protein